MAGYFSNQSQSRFSTTAAASTAAHAQEQTDNPSPLPRRVSSRHFSTSLPAASAADEKSHGQGKDRPASATISNAGTGQSLGSGVHPLRNTWVFWFRQQRAPGNKITNYEEGIKKVSSFSSVESFWSLWTHVNAPSALLPTTDYLLFHSGVRRPVWEDPLNIGGGKWIIRLKKGVADRIWENLILAIIGDQFDDCAEGRVGNDGEVDGYGAGWPEICGCTISVRQSEDIVSLWNRVDDMKVREKIRDTIRTVLNLPTSTIMEYKSNNDSMQDKSSFRNSAVDRTPL
ncbi:eukaryotic translation initiation factor 4E class II [Leucogyrophana mollusca]|uniref:Eukaryotic translation initiation factor 4E class II n=1 Tax=Leucogyrophana mollusca TaxID=85980 RepID=A0ACB8B6K2_9AGAM|nr:eukaryotic translation initiation factor 4E class II [Leucogyrophana mollusca]